MLPLIIKKNELVMMLRECVMETWGARTFNELQSRLLKFMASHGIEDTQQRKVCTVSHVHCGDFNCPVNLINSHSTGDSVLFRTFDGINILYETIILYGLNEKGDCYNLPTSSVIKICCNISGNSDEYLNRWKWFSSKELRDKINQQLNYGQTFISENGRYERSLVEAVG